jgi:cytochrome b involved in lipid metabolism
MKIYTRKEIAIHNKLPECWIIVDKKVYDITYLIETNQHPGGIKCLKRKAGQDCSTDLAFHSKFVREFYLKQFQIGILDEYDQSCAIS